MDQILLDGGNLFKGDLHAHVAPGNHDAVRSLQDLVDVFHALQILDLGNDAYIEPAQALGEFPQIVDVRRSAHKACRNEVKALLCAEFQVVHVRIAEEGHAELDAGHVDALIV